MENDLSNNKPVILAVDDDAIILNTVLSTLRENYKVIPFTSGINALRYLESHTADLILLDYYMPEMTGFEVLQKIIENPDTREIPVIFLTGSIDGDGEASVLQSGAVDYILKPVKPQTLITRVKIQLELQQHRKNLEDLVAEKTKFLNIAYNKLKMREEITVNLLARATDLRDSETGRHIERTTEFVRIIVTDLVKNHPEGYRLSAEEAEEIIKSAKLHDLGKIAIPDKILLKEGRLTDEEFAVIKTHPVHGEHLFKDYVDIIDNDLFLKTARDIAHLHHEKWNGAGYPLGLSGEEIPLSARIVAIADVYDALVSERPYKKAFTHEKAVEIIREDAGKHFDPYLVEVFLRHSDDFAGVAH